MSLRRACIALISLLVAAAPGTAYFSKTEPVVRSRDSSIYLVESRLHLEAQRWDTAVISLTKALHDNPNDVDVAIKLADMHYRAGRYAKSIEVLRDYVDRATAKRNVFYYLALSFDRLDDFRNALGYYYRALGLNPGLLKAYVRIARLRVRQGLVLDAAKALRKCLELQPDYFPALQELNVVNRLVKMSAENIYRRDNLVIVFPDHKLYRNVEEAYPRIKKSVEFLEKNLQYHVPEVWVKVVAKVPKFEHLPAFYDHMESCVYVDVEGIKKGELRPLLHELCAMYVRRLAKNNSPSWLTEGLALWVSRPAFLFETPLRSLNDRDLDFRRDFPADKQYLRWEQAPLSMRRAMMRAYLAFAYLLKNYGWPAARKLLAAYRDGEKVFEKICWEVLHIDYMTFQRQWDVFALQHYYFSPAAQGPDPLE